MVLGGFGCGGKGDLLMMIEGMVGMCYGRIRWFFQANLVFCLDALGACDLSTHDAMVVDKLFLFSGGGDGDGDGYWEHFCEIATLRWRHVMGSLISFELGR